MPKLTVYSDKTPALRTPEEQKAPLKTLQELEESLQFFRYLIAQGAATRETIHTHMGLLEHHYRELAGSTGYASILTEELENRIKETRETNLENQRLISLLGKGVSHAAVTGALRRYEDSFRAWYEALGFHYASLECTFFHGFLFNFSGEIWYSPERPDISTNGALFRAVRECLPPIADALNGPGDLERDSCRAEILDTEHAKACVTKAFRDEFPNSYVQRWESRDSQGKYHLRFTVYISFHDVEDMEGKYLKGKEPCKN